MTPDNFLALEPLIVARLREVLPACVAGDIQREEIHGTQETEHRHP